MLAHSRRLFSTIALMTVSIFSISFAQAGKNPNRKGPLKVGYSIDSLKVERWQTDLDVFQKRAQELGATVLAESAEGDDDLQFQQAQKLIGSGIKVLVLIAHNTDSAARIVNAAKAKHVKVLSYDRLVRNSDVDLFVGVDSDIIGKLQASSLAQRAPKGNYILLGGSPTDINARMARAGQMKILKPLIDRGDIKIMADLWTTDWKPSDAYIKVAQAIDSNEGEITAIVATNDGTAGGAIQALEDHKLAGKVLVSGQDADLAAIVRILEGTQTMTVYKPLAAQARLAAEAAVSMAKGKQIKTSASVENGAKSVPALILEVISVTKENVKQTVIKDGFQKVETIKSILPKEKWPLVE